MYRTWLPPPEDLIPLDLKPLVKIGSPVPRSEERDAAAAPFLAKMELGEGKT